MVEAQPGSGVTADSPAAPDFTTYARDADARDLGRASTAPDTSTGADAASPTAQPGDQAASTDAHAADSASAKPDSPKPRNLQTRKEQIETEIADLRAKLDLRRALRDELATLDRSKAEPAPESRPAKPTTAEWQRYRLHPDAPKTEDFDTYEDFVAAQATFIADKRYEEREARAKLDAESRERVGSVQRTIQTFKDRIKAAREADPEFDAKVDPGLLEIVPAFALRVNEPVRPANVLLQSCVESDAASALLLHFSTPEGQKEWAELTSQATPAAMLRAFGRVEARFLSGSAAGDVPPAKPVTTAPAPPVILGMKPPASPDRVRAAVAAGDYRAYEAAADAADLAVRRR